MNKLSKYLTAAGMLAAFAAPVLADVPLKVSVPGKAKLGQTVSVAVKTSPDVKCKIEAQDAGFTQSMKLMDQTSNKSGKANWKFDIPKDYKADKMPVTITVEKNGEQQKSVHSIEIK